MARCPPPPWRCCTERLCDPRDWYWPARFPSPTPESALFVGTAARFCCTAGRCVAVAGPLPEPGAGRFAAAAPPPTFGRLAAVALLPTFGRFALLPLPM